jgi:hypothetical protein
VSLDTFMRRPFCKTDSPSMTRVVWATSMACPPSWVALRAWYLWPWILRLTFLEYSVGSQIARQIGGIATTLGVSIVSGYATGKFIGMFAEEDKRNYRDNRWWQTEYFDVSRHLDASAHSRGYRERGSHQVSPQ